MIRVLICDDQDMVREGLRPILSTVPEIEVKGLASDGAEAVEKRQPMGGNGFFHSHILPGHTLALAGSAG